MAKTDTTIAVIIMKSLGLSETILSIKWSGFFIEYMIVFFDF
jgi:hypothetical protein